MNYILRAPAFALAVSLLTASPAFAALDAEAKTPYQLRVVLHFAPNRFLTPLLQDQLSREVRDRLGLAFGKLAQVEVVRTHPLLSEIEARGLEQALEGWEPGGQRQVFFVLVGFEGGEYRLQERRCDGMTGQVSPTVRRAETPDPGMLGSLAAEMIEQDFGPVGTVEVEGKDVRLVLRGGALGVSLDRWVRPGDVFGVSRIVGEGPRRRAQRLPWTALEVLASPRDGVCPVRLFSRQEQLREGPGIAGYRAIRLPTLRGPLRLRLVDDETDRPLDIVRVKVWAPGSTKPTELSPNRDGLVTSREDFTNLALAQVVAGDGIRSAVPVPILPGRPLVLRLAIRPGAETLATLEYRRDAWVRRIYEDLALAGERVGELNGLLKQSLEKALAKGKQGLQNLDTELTELTSERDELRKLVREKKAERLDLREGEQRLEELRQRQSDLKRFVASVDEVIQKAASEETRKLRKLTERARLLESEADYDQAIALYEQILKASPDETQVRKHLKALKKEWTPKSARHAEAREFLYKVWPTLDVAGLKANLEKAKESLAVCEQMHDRLTPRKLLRANAVHAAALQKQLEGLRQQNTADSRNQARLLAEVADGLRRLHADVTAYLAKD